MNRELPPLARRLSCGNDRIRGNGRPPRLCNQSGGVADLRKQIDMTNGTCTVDECEHAHVAKGLCGMHYQRLRKRGSLALPPQRECSVDGCVQKHHGRGYCNTHRARLLATGTLEAAPRVRKTCTFTGCERPAVSASLCGGHAQQAKRGATLKTLRPTWKSTIRDEQGRKRCSTCKGWKPEADFYPTPKQSDGLVSYCKRCDRSLRLQRSYGITVDQYDAMLAAQDGGCAICGDVPKNGQSLPVDHDHACCPGRKKSCGQCVRGLLCEDCNRVLGMFRDDRERFQSAITYLTRRRP